MLSHQLNIKGSWTITPLLPYLSNNFPGAKWFFFCVENIVIRLKKLLDVFGKFNASEVSFIFVVPLLYFQKDIKFIQ